MSKPGRNDPCPCGSGKKYKKCCLALEETRRLEDAREDDMSALFEDAPLIEADDDEASEPEEIEEIEETPGEQEPYVSKTINKEPPEIDEQEQALVDAWWAEYKTMDDPDAILAHLDAFLQVHPQLIENLGVMDEILFHLGGKLVKRERAGDYIALLKRLRERFPDAYLKAFAYFDLDIACYSVIEQGGPDGIEPYLHWFKEYPDADADNLFALIRFLMATECDAPLMDLLEATYDALIRSPHVIRGGEALDILVFGYCAPYLERGWTHADLEALAERLKALRIRLRARWYDPSFLEEHFQKIVGDLDASFLDAFRGKRRYEDAYDRVTLNFMGWLRKEKGFSWMKALFYRDQALLYLVRSIPDGKRPRQPFVFTKKLLDRTLARNAQVLLSMDPTRALGSINAVYWFAEYLAQRGLISAKLGGDIQRWCEEMWTAAADPLRHEGIAGGAFKVFPG